jgi:hypothetical protein
MAGPGRSRNQGQREAFPCLEGLVRVRGAFPKAAFGRNPWPLASNKLFQGRDILLIPKQRHLLALLRPGLGGQDIRQGHAPRQELLHLFHLVRRPHLCTL